nr:MAG TPA: hypothetical protein [Caudoviricetes sp.]
MYPPFFLACARQAGNHPATAPQGRFAWLSG